MEKFGDNAKMARYSRLCLLVIFSAIFVFILIIGIPFQMASSIATNLPTSPDLYSLPYDFNETPLTGDLNYGVIIDAGSSGSRLFVYVWPQHSGKTEDLLRIEPLKDNTGNPVVKKISPGLSSYGEMPSNATNHIFELLNFAINHIPVHKHKETSLFILATAGLRLIPESQSNAILKTLREEIPKHYQFIIMDSHIDIISGKWEGIYSWIAVNYALKRFDDVTSSEYQTPDSVVPIYDPEKNFTKYRKRTVGMIDMGGGSVQIAFETFDKIPRMQEHLTQELNLGCKEDDSMHKYRLYVTTFLGYGANVAIERYEEYLHKENGFTSSNSYVQDPCLPVNLIKSVYLNESVKPVYVRKGVGNFIQCMNTLKNLLNLHVECSDNPCSFNGVYQPVINFTSLEMFGFSEFWYSTDDILQVSGNYQWETLHDAASKFCGTKWSVLKKRHESKVYPKADNARLRTQCFKSAWISTVLHDGFRIPKNTSKFKSVSLINGQEVQWTLGALLYRLRHFPLRELQRMKELQFQPPNRRNGVIISHSGSSGYLPSDTVFQFLLIMCILVVGFACVRHFMRLRRLKNSLPNNNSSRTYQNGCYNNNLNYNDRLTFNNRNKSLMGYMMLNADEMDSFTNVKTEPVGYIY